MNKDHILSIVRRSTWKVLSTIAIVFAVLLSIYFAIVVGMLGATVDQAIGFLPTVLVQAVMAVIQMIFLMIANFALFFGPFLIYARVGLDVSEPGDASWKVQVKDVRGQAGAVNEMRKILKLIDQGRRFVEAGGTREKGVLMSGPPGTGKTMLAKAIASELQLPFISTSGASFAGMFMGMDVLKVLMLSRLAKKKAKKWGGAIVFIDEFDAIGQKRAGGSQQAGMFGGGGMMALNMLLVVMDGLDQPGFVKKTMRKLVNNLLAAFYIPFQIKPLTPPRYNIFFMAATNRPEVLDEAITRPGRFGRQISFKKPDLDDRRDIAEFYFNKVEHDLALDTDAARTEFAAITDGYSPAQIQQALSIALMYAFEHERTAFNWEDLREALANVEVGLAEPIEYHAEDAIAVARHEMGHALALHLFVKDQMPTRLSIRKRAGTLGHLSHTDKRENFVYRKDKFEGLLKVSLASTAAERLFYGVNSSGVAGDLHYATSTAARMVSMFGMGEELSKTPSAHEKLGQTMIQLPPGDEVTLKALSDDNTRRGVAVILGRNLAEVSAVIESNRDALDRLARQLVVRQELVGHEIAEFFEQEKWNA